MAIEIVCRSGKHRLRLREDKFWSRTNCPKCRTQADFFRLKRLIVKLKLLWSVRKGQLEIPDEIRFANLRWRIDRLISDAWQTGEKIPNLILPTSTTHQLSVEETIRAYLAHIEQVAPGFSVPIRVPRVERTHLADEAGQFVVKDGWVSITLSEELIAQTKTVRAVLAHEVCHYVLNNSGIREDETENNEKLTDLCMFVCGLGEIFIEGYKDEIVHKEYRVGHRLGYLSDAEYQFARRYVKKKWQTAPQSDVLDQMRKKITARVGDSAITDRLLMDQRRRFPSRSEKELYQGVLDGLDKR